ncbi:MAG: DapH/DapD/GlmU-related protein [Planctomycetota bacterium]
MTTLDDTKTEPTSAVEPDQGGGMPSSRDRIVSPYSFKEKVGRVLWSVVQLTVFRWSFHDWYRLRNMLLRLFNAKVAPTARLRATVYIEIPWNLTVGDNSIVGDRAILYCLGPVTIGDHVVVSQYAHLCAGSHDFTRPDLPLLRPPIRVGDDVWIAADAFVGPNVTVGEGALLGARASAYTDLEPWTIYGGNPARPIKTRPRFATDTLRASTSFDVRRARET